MSLDLTLEMSGLLNEYHCSRDNRGFRVQRKIDSAIVRLKISKLYIISGNEFILAPAE